MLALFGFIEKNMCTWLHSKKSNLFYLLQSYHPCVTFLARKTLIFRAMHGLGVA